MQLSLLYLDPSLSRIWICVVGCVRSTDTAVLAASSLAFCSDLEAVVTTVGAALYREEKTGFNCGRI